MRRLIAYIAMSATLTIGVAALASPLMLQMDTDLAYADGKTLYFKASRYESGSLVDSYENFLTNEDKDGETYIVDKIADTMRERLDDWGVSDYEVVSQGYDTIAVSLRSSKNKSLEYSYLQSYLAFSGQNYELDASNTSAEATEGEEGSQAGYTHNDLWETMLDGKTASFKLLDMDNFQVPVVIIPIDDEDKNAFLDLMTYCKNNTVEEEKDEEGNVTTAGKSCNVVLWANREESDRYEDKGDANVASHIFYEGSAVDDQMVYYEDGDSDKEHPYLQLIPSSKATSSGSYDPTFAQDATDAANYLVRKFNASAYEYKSDQSGADSSAYRVHFTYSEDRLATVDPLVNLGDFSVSMAFGPTMISILVGIVLLIVILALFERMFALQEIAIAGTTVLATLAAFISFGTQFNIAALLGILGTLLVSLFQSLYYTARLKNEVYKGRTLKKAQQEASKASVLPMIDSGFITILLGICLYLLGGSVCRAGGVVLTIGGFFSIFTGLIGTRFMGWLIANDSTVAGKFDRLFGIHKDRIPNLMAQEKQSYFGPFQDKKFAKGKKYAYIVASLLLLGGIGATIGIGVTHDGEIFRSSAVDNPTVLRLEVKSTEQDRISVDNFSSVSEIYDSKSSDHSDLFHVYSLDGKPLADYVTSFSLSETPKDVYETPDQGSEGTHYYYFYYEARLNSALDLDKTYEIGEWDPSAASGEGAYVAINSEGMQLVELAETISDLGGTDRDQNPNVTVTFNETRANQQSPYIGDVCLGLGVGLAAILVYLMLRYRPSRGIATMLVAVAAGFIALSFFVYTRIAVAPAVSLGLILVFLVSLLGSLFTLNREKELRKEDHDSEKNSAQKRNATLELANSYEAGNVLRFGILGLYLSLVGFGLGPVAYCSPYLLAFLGIVFAAVLVLVTMTPIASRLGTWLSKIHLSGPKRKKKQTGGNLMKRKRSGEPEEAIFIGIND